MPSGWIFCHFLAVSCPHTLLWHRVQISCPNMVVRSIQDIFESLQHPRSTGGSGRGLAGDLWPPGSSGRPAGTPRDISGDIGHLYLGNKATFTV